MRGAILLLTLALLGLPGCVVLRSTYEEEARQRELLMARLEVERGRAQRLERRLDQLSGNLESRELERSALGRERLDLMNELEDLRHDLEEARGSLEEERRQREGSEAEVQALQGSYHALVEELEDELEKGQIEILQLRGRLQIRALESILFASGSAEIKPTGREVLAKVADQLRKQSGHQVRIEGHTDRVPISTLEFPSNWELSCGRAARVLRFLVDEGLDPERMSAVGVGSQQPIESNDSPEGRARNRRIEIVLVPEPG
ncbi:MAG: OmpA family protein [Myxococcota bacterium]